MKVVPFWVATTVLPGPQDTPCVHHLSQQVRWTSVVQKAHSGWTRFVSCLLELVVANRGVENGPKQAAEAQNPACPDTTRSNHTSIVMASTPGWVAVGHGECASPFLVTLGRFWPFWPKSHVRAIYRQEERPGTNTVGSWGLKTYHSHVICHSRRVRRSR